MPNAYFYSNTAQQTTLSGSISAGATAITVGATTGFPTSFPYVLALDYGGTAEELVTVSAAAGNTLTVVRGFGGTSAQAHSLGAVVRHTYNAQDASDFRTHEATASGAHGTASAVVGVSDTQTLTNKTLTSPTINSAALSGTFTGTPTFSGNTTFTGEIAHQNLLRGSRAVATDSQYETRINGDPAFRWFVRADGRMGWSDGASGNSDVVLYREAADVLTTNDTVRTYRSSAAGNAFSARVDGDTSSRWFVNADGNMNWGPGGAVSADTDLYRSAAATLKTDGNLIVSGTLTATPALTTANGTSVVTAATGWTILYAQGVKAAGQIVILVRLAPAAAGNNITAQADGNVADTDMFTVAAGWRPSSAYSIERMPFLLADGFGHGSALLTSDTGLCQLASWIPSQTVRSDRFLRVLLTYPA